jgi:hypothetical protein
MNKNHSRGLLFSSRSLGGPSLQVYHFRSGSGVARLLVEVGHWGCVQAPFTKFSDMKEQKHTIIASF